ncbi:pilus (MSHA type) biogenesis protein MshL [Marinobacter zhanjiangensis]|uniref:Pilus (MSHA type) biogenesis protein MshL n=1 Tax=Marinobacter zhanjiangensis TaxID=578215 RepID=A0ABQ3B5Y7_9GAMM|nr:pilus (MSHA type) biogenesis protein MshL [Marinobacter zhanjiangensis]GGY80907.1 pilus (MSHA type) biogenesis protein MshL [Marinobacter zhanjiangensis]
MTLTRYGTLALLALTLTACASNPSMRTGQATSTESARAIDEALGEAEQQAEADQEQARQRSAPDLPADVSAALLPPLEQPEEAEQRFDVNARGVEARSFFEALVEGTGYNVVVHPGVSTTIDLRLNDVTVPEVMDIARDVYGLSIQRKGRLFQVDADRVQTRLFPINYLDFKRSGSSETRVSSGQVSSTRSSGNSDGGSDRADQDSGSSRNLVGTRISTETESDFWRDLSQALTMLVGTGDNHQVITNPGAGLVMVSANGETLRQVQDYLERTELIMQRQVVLEAKILEVALNEGYQQGINWSDVQSSAGRADYFTSQSLDGQTIRSGGIGGVFSAAVSAGDFSGLIQLLGEQGNVQTLSSPRIATVNNQKAVIKVGTDEFFVTDIDFDEDNNSLNPSDSTSTSIELTPFFSGISLDVTPQIAEDGSVTLHVHPAVSEVDDQQKVITVGDRDVTLPLALSTVRETDSVIRAESGQIVVIGGLIQNISEDDNAAVPFFSEIPILGEAFRQRNFQSRKSELVILIRPIVVGVETMSADISASRERMQVLRELLQSSESPTPEPEGGPR